MMSNTKYKNIEGDYPGISGGDLLPFVPTTTAGETNKQYSILQWPPDLGDTRYPHYVTFYINVNSKSSIATDNNTSTITDLSKKSTATYGYGGTSGNTSTTKQTTTTSEIPADDGTFEGKISQIGEIIKQAAGEFAGKFSSSYKRLHTAIILPMPQTVQQNFSAAYNEVDIGVMGSMIRDIWAGEGVLDASKKAMASAVQSAPRAVLDVAGGSIGSLIGAAISKTGAKGAGGAAGAAVGAAAAAASSRSVGEMFSKMSGLARNPKSEQIFDRIQTRTFDFTWIFAPRSKSEYESVKEIIKTFKIHMHPELNDKSTGAAGDNFLIMPSEFDIEYRISAHENEEIGRVGTCVLTDVSVNYTPQNAYTPIVDEDGNPTGMLPLIHLSIRFKEVEPLVRNKIEKNGF